MAYDYERFKEVAVGPWENTYLGRLPTELLEMIEWKGTHPWKDQHPSWLHINHSRKLCSHYKPEAWDRSKRCPFRADPIPKQQQLQKEDQQVKLTVDVGIDTLPLAKKPRLFEPGLVV